MRLDAVHVAPVWEQPDGTRRVGIDHDPAGGTPALPVVGWCCVGVVRLGGTTWRLLLTRHAAGG